MPAEPSPNPSTPAANPAVTVAIAILLTLVGVALFFLQTRGIGLMGHDSYPILLTARIESFGDFVGTFTEELMDGRYSGDYYRPLLNLSFALDYAVSGLQPVGYQLSSALIFGAVALSMFFLARRLCGGSAVYGPLLALVVLLLHESQFEVLPVPPRRPELLCALFAFLSFYSQLGPKQLGRRWPWVPALWMGCAVLSKETALVMPAFSFVAVWLYSTRSGARERTIHALRAIAAHAILIVLMVGVRFVVLGGIGGPGEAPPGPEPLSSFELSTRLVTAILAPASWFELRSTLLVLSALFVLFLASLSLRQWMGSRSGGAAEADASPLRAIAFAAVWFLALCLVYAMTGKVERWYFFLPVTGLCLLFGGALELLMQCLRGGDATLKWRARIGLVLLAVLVFVQVRYSPLFQHYDEWDRATAVSEEFFAGLSEHLEAATDGLAIEAPPLPVWVTPAVSGPTVFGGAVLSDYSVQAWCELRYPDRKVRVISRPGPPPAADEVVVMLRSVREGFAPGRR